MSNQQVFHLRPEGEKAFGYAQAVRAGNALYISGTLSVNDTFQPIAEGDMVGQLETIYQTIIKTLSAHGGTLNSIVKETIYVSDMEAFLAANSVRIDAYKGYELPATTAVEVSRLAFPECMAEIEVIAEL